VYRSRRIGDDPIGYGLETSQIEISSERREEYMGGSCLRAQASQSSYDVSAEKDILVKMRDGTLLATDLYRPAKDKRPAPARAASISMALLHALANPISIFESELIPPGVSGEIHCRDPCHNS